MFIIPDARGKTLPPPPIILLFYCLNPIISCVEVAKMSKQTFYVCLYNFKKKKKKGNPQNFLRLCLPSWECSILWGQTRMESEGICENEPALSGED